MKTKMLTIALLITVNSAFANDAKYTESMAKNIELIYNAGTNDEIQQVINVFDRIANAEKSKWEPTTMPPSVTS